MQVETRVGKDGKERKVPPKKDKSPREPKATPKHVVDTPPEPDTPDPLDGNWPGSGV